MFRISQCDDYNDIGMWMLPEAESRLTRRWVGDICKGKVWTARSAEPASNISLYSHISGSISESIMFGLRKDRYLRDKVGSVAGLVKTSLLPHTACINREDGELLYSAKPHCRRRADRREGVARSGKKLPSVSGGKQQKPNPNDLFLEPKDPRHKEWRPRRTPSL